LKTYEGMFLLDAGQPNFEEAAAPVRTVFERNQAEVIHLKKWDERRLAYDIMGRRRGLYVLSYFRADPTKITEIERDVQLDERIIRVLILSADHLTEEQMASAAAPTEHEPIRRERREGEPLVEAGARAVETPVPNGADVEVPEAADLDANLGDENA
jgi:small subunit ribosomal protein S6